MASEVPLAIDNAEKHPEDKTVEDTDKPEDEAQKPPLKNFARILSYGSRVDHLFMIAALCTAVSLRAQRTARLPFALHTHD
jgi:hypothetical protein